MVEVRDATGSTRSTVLTDADLRRVRAVLFLNGVRGADLDDAEQEVQVRLIERPPRTADATAGWAAVVATRLAMDLHRREANRRRALTRLMLNSRDTGPAVDSSLAVAVRGALRGLDPELRAVVVLRYYADLSVAEIAHLTDVPEGTVKSRLHRAAAVLRPALTEETS